LNHRCCPPPPLSLSLFFPLFQAPFPGLPFRSGALFLGRRRGDFFVSPGTPLICGLYLFCRWLLYVLAKPSPLGSGSTARVFPSLPLNLCKHLPVELPSGIETLSLDHSFPPYPGFPTFSLLPPPGLSLTSRFPAPFKDPYTAERLHAILRRDQVSLCV